MSELKKVILAFIIFIAGVMFLTSLGPEASPYEDYQECHRNGIREFVCNFDDEQFREDHPDL